ncbi:MAG: D-glycero-beta-D-manno-heptose-7-phosphate kinase [Betaproteobacteria bacterium]|nr:D-glycero-beta-D-manno-heptose-7-phosphate kinase [Betaproteobacteria bacterium]
MAGQIKVSRRAGERRAKPSLGRGSFKLEERLLRRARILAVGDVMLDRYWFGEVDRVSPEAPVPIVKIDRTDDRPGGAANVARNAAALGAHVTLLSVVGADQAGQRLAQLMKADGVHAKLHRDHSIDTTVKVRVLGRHQQMLRIDFETIPSHEVLLDKLAAYKALLARSDIVVLSDYGKGGLTHISRMIDLAVGSGKRVLVDPKGDDYSRYRGATVVTPNRSELRDVVGAWSDERHLTRKAQALRQKLGIEALLLTRSEEGMTLFQKGLVSHEPAKAREVFDVSGAGDTVIAVLAVMLGAGASLGEATRIANHAAGVVVGKLGTAVAHTAELVASLNED